MNPSELPAGCAIVCAPDGAIRRIIRDDLGLFSARTPELTLFSGLDEASHDKARLFLAELRLRQAAFDWELNVPVSGKLTSLHFAGSVTDEGLLIIGAGSRDGVARLYDELMSINNEQMTALRHILKETAFQAQLDADRDSGVFDELTRLNNDLANMQRVLAKTNAELEQLNREKNQFLGMAAHDLRSPLGVILGYSQFLQTDATSVLSPEQLEFLAVIQNRSEFMLHLIDDLLDISRIEAGRLDLDLRSTDVADLIRRNVMLNDHLATQKSIKVSYESEGDIPPLTIDGGKIEQVLDNLLSNAIKFSQPRTHIAVRLMRSGREMVLSVRDEGPGIPVDEVKKLFRPFQKTSVRSTSGEKSTGLGLVIVRKIVEGHHGRIWVESEVGQGSTFSFALPVE
jgi:two-component system, OmpR family, sensor kinase